MTKPNKQHRKRYIESFKRRYGMTRAEYRDLKESDPQKAHEVRMKAQSLT